MFNFDLNLFNKICNYLYVNCHSFSKNKIQNYIKIASFKNIGLFKVSQTHFIFSVESYICDAVCSSEILQHYYLIKAYLRFILILIFHPEINKGKTSQTND